MAKIILAKSHKVIEVPEGSILMKALLDADVPVASSCDGDGVCGKCRLKIISGADGLAPESQNEQEIKEIHDMSKNERVSCQAVVIGTVTVDAPYW